MNLTSQLRRIIATSDSAATAAEPSFSASFADILPDGRRLLGDSVGSLDGETAVAIVDAGPVGRLSREIDSIMIYNRDTVAHVITVAKEDDGAAYTIAKANVGAGESMIYDGRTWSAYTAAGEQKTSQGGAATSAAGAKNGTTVSVVETGDGLVHKTVLTFADTPITIADDAGVAQYGGVLAYTFPDGLIMTLGAVVEGSLTAGVTGTIIDNWDGDVALGSAAATTGATLTGTEADILPSAAVSAGAADKIGVVSAASSATALTETGARWLDGRATPAKTYLNFVIDDDATHTAGSATFTGTVTLTWINLGN